MYKFIIADLVFGLISAWIIHGIAQRNNWKNPWLWAVGGVAGNVIAIAIVLLISRYAQARKAAGKPFWGCV